MNYAFILKQSKIWNEQKARKRAIITITLPNFNNKKQPSFRTTYPAK